MAIREHVFDRPGRSQSPSMEALPVEIIQAVFLELCPPAALAVFPLRKDEPRLLITHVCSRWRAIALSTSTLWARYYIHFHFSCSRPQPQSDPIRAWISRAAQSPLSLNICGPAIETSPMISELVLPIIHRCSSLFLCINTATLNQLLTLPCKPLHMLQNMSVLVEDDTQIAGPTPFATAFDSCPQLHTFAYIAIGNHRVENLGIANFNVPWHQLTTLRLCSPSILAHECLDILRSCISLQECKVDISPIDDLALQRIVEYSHHPTILSFLHTLHIRFLDLENDSCHFLRVFRFPRLQGFQPTGLVDAAPWPLPGVQSVLCDTIEELDLSGFKFPESLSETLALVPNLKTLRLSNDFHKYPTIMRALGEGTLSPRLTTLYLETVESFDFLFDIIEARIAAAHADHGIATFIKVVVLLDRGGDPPNEARLMALTGAGVQIRLGCPI
ncbi:hypothetical protein BD779DRAFT_1536051 [Infundibulicybe gibba]|nr:hypothetical protein BD779DRAFT_1536051 [Infundibulicybe gibba]